MQVDGSPVDPLSERRMVPKAPASTTEKRVFVPSVMARVPVFPIARSGAVEDKVIGVAELLVSPPFNATAVVVVAPRPVTDERVSDSEVRAPLVELIVIVEPVDETVVPPEPAIVRAPGRVLTEVTTSVASRLIVGVWPVDTLIPVPPTAP